MAYHAIKFRPDLIIATLPGSALVGYSVSKILRVKLLYYPFEIYGEEYQRLKNKDSLLIGVLIEKILLRYCIDALITQNKFRADFYIKSVRLTKKPYNRWIQVQEDIAMQTDATSMPYAVGLFELILE